MNNCNKNTENCCLIDNIDNSYDCKGISKAQFCGSNDGKNLQITEYEVY